MMSGLLAVWSYLDLIKDMIRHHKAQPIATRLGLCFALVLGCVGVGTGGGTSGDLVISVTYALLSLVVVGLTLHGRTDFDVTLVDKICLVISVFGALGFFASGESVVGIAFAIGADLVAYLPTIRKGWYRPETQPVTTYVIGWGAAVLALAAGWLSGGITIGSSLTVYLIVIDCGLPAMIVYRKRKLSVLPRAA
jgi:uncharacterized membrane protein